MSVKTKIPGYTSRDFDLIVWDGVQEVAFFFFYYYYFFFLIYFCLHWVLVAGSSLRHVGSFVAVCRLFVVVCGLLSSCGVRVSSSLAVVCRLQGARAP